MFRLQIMVFVYLLKIISMKNLIIIILFSLSAQGQNICGLDSVLNFQKVLNEQFKEPGKSPLTEADLKNFKELDFFQYNPQLCIEARFVRTPNEKPFKMETTTERLPEYVKYGEAHFEIDDKTFRLNLYQNVEMSVNKLYKDNLFLPFSDLTSGEESYIGGRYIDLKIPESDTVTINFNLAYNPYCAYNYKYSCPKVPLENDLPVMIRAGVKDFK